MLYFRQIQRLGFVFALILILFLTTQARADEPFILDETQTIALGHCADLENKINMFVTPDLTLTKCYPIQGQKGWSFLLVAAEPVFLLEASKKAWLLSAIGIFGFIFNNNATRTEELVLTDLRSAREGVFYRMTSPVARKLQRQVKSNQITLDEMYASALAAMKAHRAKRR